MNITINTLTLNLNGYIVPVSVSEELQATILEHLRDKQVVGLITPKKDDPYWKTEVGRRQLKDSAVNCMTVEEAWK